MTELTAEEVSKYERNMKELVPRTCSSGEPELEFHELMNKKNMACIIIGCMNIFEWDKYYDISSQEDIDKLVSSCIMGRTMEVRWYCLTNGKVDKGYMKEVVIF